MIVIGGAALKYALEQAERVLVNETSARNPVRSAVTTGNEFKVLGFSQMTYVAASEGQLPPDSSDNT